MGFRNIFIAKQIQLVAKNEQLAIGDYTIALEDINSIIIENPMVTLSAYLIDKIAEYGIACYICDKKHNPSSVVLPLVRHSRHFLMLDAQIKISKVLKKRLWKKLVIQKIRNQSLCLKELGKEGYEEISMMSSGVLSGDKGNVEAKAAAIYFRFLFGNHFVRREESIINAALNYCYSIIRGQIARTVVCHGLEPSLGLNHKNQLNSFNLVDDFIEPYRPVADYYVSNCLEGFDNNDTVLTSEHKHKLVNINLQDVFINGGQYTISKSIDLMVGSYVSILNGQRDDLLLPKLINFQVHRYE